MSEEIVKKKYQKAEIGRLLAHLLPEFCFPGREIHLKNVALVIYCAHCAPWWGLWCQS